METITACRFCCLQVKTELGVKFGGTNEEVKMGQGLRVPGLKEFDIDSIMHLLDGLLYSSAPTSVLLFGIITLLVSNIHRQQAFSTSENFTLHIHFAVNIPCECYVQQLPRIFGHEILGSISSCA